MTPDHTACMKTNQNIQTHQERYDSYGCACLRHPIRNGSHACVYHSHLLIIIRFHASDSIRCDAEMFATVRKTIAEVRFWIVPFR